MGFKNVKRPTTYKLYFHSLNSQTHQRNDFWSPFAILHILIQRERRKFAFSLQQLGFFIGKKFLLRISILWQVQKFAWLSPSRVKAIDISVLWLTYSWDLIAGILRQIKVGCCIYLNSFVVEIECKLFKGHRGEHMTLFCSDSEAWLHTNMNQQLGKTSLSLLL